jgi:hypothetical protein
MAPSPAFQAQCLRPIPGRRRADSSESHPGPEPARHVVTVAAYMWQARARVSALCCTKDSHGPGESES